MTPNPNFPNPNFPAPTPKVTEPAYPAAGVANPSEVLKGQTYPVSGMAEYPAVPRTPVTNVFPIPVTGAFRTDPVTGEVLRDPATGEPFVVNPDGSFTPGDPLLNVPFSLHPHAANLRVLAERLAHADSSHDKLAALKDMNNAINLLPINLP